MAAPISGLTEPQRSLSTDDAESPSEAAANGWFSGLSSYTPSIAGLTSLAAVVVDPASYTEAMNVTAAIFAGEETPEAQFLRVTKYKAVISSIREALDPASEDLILRSLLEGITLKFDSADYQVQPKAGTEGEMNYHIVCAFRLLSGSGEAALSPRDQFKAYKAAMRAAAETTWYKENCIEDRGAGVDSPMNKLLMAMAYAEFTKVEIGEVTQGFVEMRSKKPATIALEGTSSIDALKKAFSLNSLVARHTLIGNEETLGQKIKGETTYLELDPSIQGNPTNVKEVSYHKTLRKSVVNVRTSTPTKGNEVTPEFKIFLRALKRADKRYVMVNLQKRQNPGTTAKSIGIEGEHERSMSLEALQIGEFADVITVFTLDKNMEFYSQTFLDMERKDYIADRFIDIYMGQLWSKDTSYHVPEKFMREHYRVIRAKLEMIHARFFQGRENLTREERQDFVEISYLYLTDLFIEKSGADFFNQSCKDCIDRGGGANWLKIAVQLLFEASEGAEGSCDPELLKKIAAHAIRLDEDALWARKRGIIHKHGERVHSRIISAQSALQRFIDVMESDSESFAILKEEYGFERASFKFKAAS